MSCSSSTLSHGIMSLYSMFFIASGSTSEVHFWFWFLLWFATKWNLLFEKIACWRMKTIKLFDQSITGQSVQIKYHDVKDTTLTHNNKISSFVEILMVMVKIFYWSPLQSKFPKTRGSIKLFNAFDTHAFTTTTTTTTTTQVFLNK